MRLPLVELVHGLDLGREGLRDLLALHLLRSGDEPVLGRPLLPGEDDGLEELHRFEAVLLAHRVELLEEEGHDGLVVAEVVERLARVDPGGVLERLAEVLGVGDDDRHGLLRVGVGVHADVGDEVAGLVDRLEALERDVLSDGVA